MSSSLHSSMQIVPFHSQYTLNYIAANNSFITPSITYCRQLIIPEVMESMVSLTYLTIFYYITSLHKCLFPSPERRQLKHSTLFQLIHQLHEVQLCHHSLLHKGRNLYNIIIITSLIHQCNSNLSMISTTYYKGKVVANIVIMWWNGGGGGGGGRVECLHTSW